MRIFHGESHIQVLPALLLRRCDWAYSADRMPMVLLGGVAMMRSRQPAYGRHLAMLSALLSALLLTGCPGEDDSSSDQPTSGPRGSGGDAGPSITTPSPPASDPGCGSAVVYDDRHLSICANSATDLEVTNISNTIIHVISQPGLSLSYLRSKNSLEPDQVKAALKSFEDQRYQGANQYGAWIQPEDTFGAVWRGGVRRTLRYEFDPGESAALSLANAAADETILKGERAGKTAGEWKACYEYTVNRGRRLFSGRAEISAATWNQVLDDALGFDGCRTLVTSDDESLAKKVIQRSRNVLSVLDRYFGRTVQVAAEHF